MSLDNLKNSVLYQYMDNLSLPEMREAAEVAFDICPDYIWTMPVSTSGKYHGEGEKQVDHVDHCCWVLVNKVWQQMDSVWDTRMKNISLVAMLTHDNYKCGYPGQENFKNGKMYTHHDHAAIGAEMLRQVWFNLMLNSEQLAKDLGLAAEAVFYHYGPWGRNKEIFLQFPLSDVRAVIHTIDYYDTCHAMMRRQRGF